MDFFPPSKPYVLVYVLTLCSQHKVGGVQSFASVSNTYLPSLHNTMISKTKNLNNNNAFLFASVRGGIRNRGGDDYTEEDKICGTTDDDVEETPEILKLRLEKSNEEIILKSLKQLGLNDTVSDIIVVDGESFQSHDASGMSNFVTSCTINSTCTTPTDTIITALPISTTTISAWPCMDKLDKRLVSIALPCIANFAINPLVGAVDLFWINRMGNTLAVAGQAAANQIFSSAFWLTSFLPSVTATLVAKEKAKGSVEGVQDAICQAFIVGTFIAILGSSVILNRPDSLLGGVLKEGAPAREFARPYLLIRGFAFLPSLYSLIGFSAFRGVMDTITPLKISLFANLMNAILDPILIFNTKMGVTGAALATLFAENTSAIMFIALMFKKKLIVANKLFKKPELEKLVPLLKGGAALQLRNFALNLTFLAVTRVTQSIDETGVSAAAHAMAIQTFQIGGIVLLALSTVAQFVVPGEMVEKIDEITGEQVGGLYAAKAVVNRLMSWGFILGSSLGILQIILIPQLQKSTPLLEVREAARTPALLASLYQMFNGLVFIGEGVMVGTGSFLQLSLSTLVATLGTLLALRHLPPIYGLTGVWMSFGVFNTLRLIGVYIHQNINGPLAKRKIEGAEKSKNN